MSSLDFIPDAVAIPVTLALGIYMLVSTLRSVAGMVELMRRLANLRMLWPNGMPTFQSAAHKSMLEALPVDMVKSPVKGSEQSQSQPQSQPQPQPQPQLPTPPQSQAVDDRQETACETVQPTQTVRRRHGVDNAAGGGAQPVATSTSMGLTGGSPSAPPPLAESAGSGEATVQHAPPTTSSTDQEAGASWNPADPTAASGSMAGVRGAYLPTSGGLKREESVDDVDIERWLHQYAVLATTVLSAMQKEHITVEYV